MRFIIKTLKFLSVSAFVLVFTWVSAQLFFERETADLMTSVSEKFNPPNSVGQKDELHLVNAFSPDSLDPNVLEFNSRKGMVNIFEGLVALDRDLNVQPALALSWGLIDDFTWEFELRKGVKFHDGSKFEVDDVLASLDRAREHEKSELKDILQNIASYERIDDFSLRIKTKNPDPLLLQKLANVYILPSELAVKDFERPIGTGPYKLKVWLPGQLLEYTRFASYWAGKANYHSVRLSSFSDLVERVETFRSGEADFLADVPYVAVDMLLEEGLEVVALPSLEVQFLLFNLDSKEFSKKGNREAFSAAIDQDAFADFVGEYAKPVNQFVSNGVFGFNPRIREHEYDLEKAISLAEESGFEGETIHFHLPIGLDGLGEHVRTQLSELGVKVVVSYLDMPNLLESIEDRKADVYFFGFKADSGDASDFFETVVRSSAELNVSGFSSTEVDSLIDESLTLMNDKARLAKLQELMSIVSERELIGVPLFEYLSVYSYAPELTFEPRTDGFIYFDDIDLKR